MTETSFVQFEPVFVSTVDLFRVFLFLFLSLSMFPFRKYFTIVLSMRWRVKRDKKERVSKERDKKKRVRNRERFVVYLRGLEILF